MYIGQIGREQQLRIGNTMSGQSGLAKIAEQLQTRNARHNVDMAVIESKLVQKVDLQSETGIYSRDSSRMRMIGGISYTQAEPDERLRAEILPPSEKAGYTKEDALMNQYMKQYRIEGRFEGDTFVLTSDKPVRIILPDMVSDAQLESFREQLSQTGLGKEIDWKQVENDFSKMDMCFDNAERLETKVDYVASRYAVLKDRIQNEYTGDERTEQMDRLQKLYNGAKEEMADTFAKTIGGFYESLGQTGAAEEFKAGIMEITDKRTNDYETYLSTAGEYADIS